MCIKYKINATISQKTIEIHRGDITHHQDHVATTVTPINFKTINTIVNNPANPIPLDEDDELLIITYNKRESD